LRILGKPSHISSQNHIILRASFPPSIGAQVVNESNSIIGKVIDVFGPVDKPFISIKPSSSINPSAILEETLFIKEAAAKKKHFKNKNRRV
jgi:rRNA processing protein Gar1